MPNLTFASDTTNNRSKLLGITFNFERLNCNLTLIPNSVRVTHFSLVSHTIKLGLVNVYTVKAILSYKGDNIVRLNLILEKGKHEIANVYVGRIYRDEKANIAFRIIDCKLICSLVGERRTVSNFVTLPKSYSIARYYAPTLLDITPSYVTLTIDINSLFMTNETHTLSDFR